MADLREHLQTILGDAYTLERELGGGGMARVFLAEETALGRRVVLKVLAPDVAQELSAERFAREIRVSARLQHPNVVPVLTAGTAGGVPYYIMPYVEGETLRARLSIGAAVPLAEAIGILRDIARALAHAHERGVVHRDIKPENVLLTRDAALVADFGIAKALDAARAVGAATPGVSATTGFTQLGVALGTPAYMAPEQAAGDPAVDYRADVYAWGIVAYELLSGAHPFAGRQAPHAMIVAHLTEMPAPLAGCRSDLPSALAAVVLRCLAKDPADRPAEARELVETFGVLGTVGLSAHAAGLPIQGASARGAPPPSLAVLPMVNTSGDPESEHFSDGLTDELIGALSKVAALRVTGRTSSFALKGKGLDVRAIAARLGVGVVLEGSVRRAGSRLKVSVQLVSAEGSVRWSERYDRTLTDVFEVQEEIAQAVVRSLSLHLGAAQGPLVRPATANLTAYDLYLKGKFTLRRLAPDDLRRAIGYFEQAIGLDQEFAAAYAWLCNAHVLAILFGGHSGRGSRQRASEYAVRAVALDSTLADAHWMRAMVAFCWDLDWAGAERAFQRALALEPGHGDARHLHAIYLLAQRRFDEARAELTRAVATDPLLADAYMTFGRLYLSTSQPDEAVGYLRESLEISPEFSFARGYLGHAYLLKGMGDAAVSEFERAATSGLLLDRAQLAYAYASVGRRADAAALLQTLLASDENGARPLFHIAMAYVGLGDIDEAFRWLERAYAERLPFLVGQLTVEPAFVPLWTDARFTALVRRLGLAVET
ncbi:MAG: protein kinase [Actinomycetota bacterium]|nr:protein kinase [Actinomycetota bacterium]